VTLCILRIFTIEQIIILPVTVAKHLVVLIVLEDSCVQRLIATKYCSGPLCWNNDRSLFQHSVPL